MRHAPTTDFTLPTPELMAIVMRRSGESTTRRDFLMAPETCELTTEQLEANMGAAARLVETSAERQVFPLRPLMPWDADPEYRKERVAHAGRLVALGMSDTAAIVATLERGGYDVEEMLALWDEIMPEAMRQMQQQPHLTPLAGVIADLTAALDLYETPDLNAEARQLARSMRVALDGLRDNQMLPRQHVLATVRAFAAANEWSGFDPAWQPKVNAACTTLAKLWGL